MEQDNIVIEVTINTILHAPKPKAWEYVCKKHRFGYFIYAYGRPSRIVEISIETLEEIGYIEVAEECRRTANQIKTNPLLCNICEN